VPKLGKAHSAQTALKFAQLGWTLKHEFRAEGDSEPYEYVFEWTGPGEPVYPAGPELPPTK
jgi:hypothetical protein